MVVVTWWLHGGYAQHLSDDDDDTEDDGRARDEVEQQSLPRLEVALRYTSEIGTRLG